MPGRSWAAWARALGHLLPPLRVADLGCGDGYLTIEASRWASRVIAIDRSRPVLERAMALAKRRGVRNITWRQGGIERVPLRDASVDVAILSQALHHAQDPERALSEAARIVSPGGHVLVLDLREHDQEWVTERLGDRWHGFSEEALDEAAGRRRPQGREGHRRRAASRRPVHGPHRQRPQACREDSENQMSTDTRFDHLCHSPSPAARARADARRRHGDDDPALQADRSGLPRRALRRAPEGSARQQRRARS